MDGILLINKEKGLTSFDVIRKLKKILNTTKIGHAGTLDPFAEGLLIVLVGKATKLSNYFMNQHKTYEGIITFGTHYDTYDYTGHVLASSDKIITIKELENIKKQFIGFYKQMPPLYSAIKKDGKKLYEYARSGIEVSVDKRLVEIKDLEFKEENNNNFYFKTIVSSGTYIRSLAVDIAESVNTYAHLTSLKRLSSGNFDVNDAYYLEAVNNDSIIKVGQYFNKSPKVILNDYMIKLVKNGIVLDERQIMTNEIFRVFDENDNLVALYEPVAEYTYKPLIIL